jgi:O-methyltransferase
MESMLKNLIRNSADRLGYEIKKKPIVYDAPVFFRPWESESDFMEQFSQAQPATLLLAIECYHLYQLIKQSSSLAGDFAEVGVYRGGTAQILAHHAQHLKKELHLFDTFTGMPDTDPQKDWHKKGDFSDTSLEAVRARIPAFDGLHFHQGFFPATASPIADKQFSVVHIDVDIYNSVKDCCEFFYPRIVQGGILLFDDYGRPTCPGAKLAVDEFFADKPEYRFYLHTGQCFVHKL